MRDKVSYNRIRKNLSGLLVLIPKQDVALQLFCFSKCLAYLVVTLQCNFEILSWKASVRQGQERTAKPLASRPEQAFQLQVKV